MRNHAVIDNWKWKKKQKYRRWKQNKRKQKQRTWKKEHQKIDDNWELIGSETNKFTKTWKCNRKQTLKRRRRMKRRLRQKWKIYAEYIKMRSDGVLNPKKKHSELKISSLFHTVFRASKNSRNEKSYERKWKLMKTDNSLTIKHWSSSNSQFRRSQSSKQRKKNPKKATISQWNTPPKVSTSSNYCSQRQSKTDRQRERERGKNGCFCFFFFRCISCP